MAAYTSVEDIEAKLRAELVRKQVRLGDRVFSDFDRLRSGRVTASQFVRGLASSGLPVSPSEAQTLAEAYATGTGEVNYREFVNSVEAAPTAVELEKSPTKRLTDTRDLLSSVGRSVNLNTSDKRDLKAICQRAKQFVAYRNQLVKNWFVDFDRHHIGEVTFSQFLRGFPYELTPKEVDLLYRAYAYETNGNTLVRYEAFADDCHGKGSSGVSRSSGGGGGTANSATATRTNYVDTATNAGAGGTNNRAQWTSGYDNNNSSGARGADAGDGDDGRLVGVVAGIVEKLQHDVFTKRVRFAEHFTDRDPRRCGLISATQFTSACGMARFDLSSAELDTLVRYYTATADGRVAYREFLEDVEAVFVTKGLEGNPRAQVNATVAADVSAAVNSLPRDYERALNDVLRHIGTTVRDRRMNLLWVFKDFDKQKRGKVTQSRFERVLASMGLDVPPSDVLLLIKKFAVSSAPHSDINYLAFCTAVDPDGMFSGEPLLFNPTSNKLQTLTAAPPRRLRTIERDLLDSSKVSPLSPAASLVTSVKLPELADSREAVDMPALMRKLRNLVVTRRLRVAEGFITFDRLRTGLIPTSQFWQGISLLGISLSPAALEALADEYASGSEPPTVRWKDFCDDLEAVFTAKGLERAPTARVDERAGALRDDALRSSRAGLGAGGSCSVGTSGAGGGLTVSLSERDEVLRRRVIARMRETVRHKRLLVKPAFDAVDWFKRGYVTPNHARRVITSLRLECSDAETDVLLRAYANETGDFAYRQFVLDIDPETYSRPADAAEQRALIETKQAAAKEDAAAASSSSVDVPLLITRLQNTVFTQRIRVGEFMADHDRRRCGRIPDHKFCAALTAAKLECTGPEFAALCDAYESSLQPGFVEYKAFVDDMEAVFTTRELESAPRAAVGSYRAQELSEPAPLAVVERDMLRGVVDRLLEAIHTRRIEIKPMFQDRDRLNSGCVTKAQFDAVLGVFFALSDKERNVLHKIYMTDKGTVNYRKFLQRLGAF